MKGTARGGTAPALAILGAALASMLPTWARLPVLSYDPIGRGLRVAQLGAPGGPRVEITYYGIYLVAAAGFVIGALAGRLIERRVARSPLLDAWALSALVIAAAYQVWSLWS